MCNATASTARSAQHSAQGAVQAVFVLLLAFAPPGFGAEPAAAAQVPDLRLHDIATIFTQEQIDRVLARTHDPDTIEEVEVERNRGRQPLPSTPVIATPLVAAGILSPFWALAHPLQAWRILAPVPPDQARFIGNVPEDATDSYRPPTLPRL